MSTDLNALEPFGQDVGFGYLDREVRSPRKYQPHLVLNTATDSMLRAIRYELQRATSFTFSVAFVSPRAIALLKQELVDFQGVGRIITSDYLGFNSPQAFSELLNLAPLGIDARLHPSPAFHPKGYVFHRADGVTAILGSSNLTEGALARNHEWNLRVSASSGSDLADQFTNLLDEELFSSVELTQKWIDEYARTYQPPIKAQRPLDHPTPGTAHFPADEIVPNAMQIEALAAIARVRETGKDRALVISATGTGKTILSALDVKAVNPKRLLFVAHREQILDRAMREFHRVLGGPESDFGKLAGISRQSDRRHVFASVQTLSQPHILQTIHPDAFDYILIDEVHRAGATSFVRVLDHFRPQFLLGMTATPERTDGVNIFEIFEYNVPYEIRLKSALEQNMLSPFHYYGVADVTFEDGQTTSETTAIANLVGPNRVRHILKALATYGQVGVAPRGLIFCSRKEEARALSLELNQHVLHGEALRTVALTGDDSIEARERVVERLEAGELDYVLTVDIFNEGVDIPTINQIVMLRQTESSIVFVQQLGRGLRNAPGKEYLVVIDFIGNYANNFLIPIALFGDQSLNKESLRKNLIAAEEMGVIAGLSSVSFDRIAQARVLKSLATTKLDSFPNLKAAIEKVRNRVGHMPALFDFLRFESVDPTLLATKVGIYPELITKLFREEELALTLDESRFLSTISKELLTAKRPQELLLIRQLLADGALAHDAVISTFQAADVPASDSIVRSAIRSVTLEFNTAAEREHFGIDTLAEVDDAGVVRLGSQFAAAYHGSLPFRKAVDDVVDTGLAIIAERYDSAARFTLGLFYSRKDASRLLDWSTNMYSTIYGYKVDLPTLSCPIFITLHKSDEISASTSYEDTLLDPHTMLWYSRSNRLLTSSELAPILDNSVDLYVFAKKDDAEGTDFYYLGQARSSGAEQTTMPARGKDLAVVRMTLKFEQPVDAAIFDYFQARTI